MYRLNLVVGATLLTCLLGADWRGFRGPDGSNASGDQLPAKWESQVGDGWKVPLPGRGLSGPIVVGDRVFVTACSGAEQDRLHVLAFDVATGNKLWQRQFWATGRTMTHKKTCTAAPTPVSDGQHVFALFSSNDLFCLDLDGNVCWLRGLTAAYPNASNSLGMASSPLLAEGRLIVKLETDSESVALAIDAVSGRTTWEVARPKLASWTSPFTVQRPDGSLAIALQSGKGLAAYDVQSGEKLWEYASGCSTIPSSVARDNVALVPSNGMVALRDNGVSSAPEVLWEANRLQPSTATPLIIGDRVYIINRSILRCASMADGELIWQARLEGNFTSSPVAAGKLIFVFNEDGKAQVIQDDGEAGTLVSSSELGETILCTPAISRGALFVRSDQHLFKIAD